MLCIWSEKHGNFHSEYVRTYFEPYRKNTKKISGNFECEKWCGTWTIIFKFRRSKNVLNHPFDYVIGSLHKLGKIDLGWIQFTESNAGYIGDTYYAVWKNWQRMENMTASVIWIIIKNIVPEQD